MSETITFSKSSMWKYLALFLIVAVVIVFFVKSAPSNTPDDSGGKVIDGNAQKVVISYKNYNYYPNTIRAKVGIPLSITLDKSVQGCFRTFVVPDFDVNEYSESPSQTITFTPDKKGTFKFRCGMGMGTGILIVE